MHYFLRNTLKDLIRAWERTDVLRTDEESVRARESAQAARKLLLHDNTSNELIEKWIDEHTEVR